MIQVLDRTQLREIAVRYCWSLLHRFYRWGGDNPAEGYDCSGAIQDVLAAVGLDPPGDQTAQMLWDHFKEASLPLPSSVGPRFFDIPPGALVFFGKSVARITHIGMSIGFGIMFEAGGGGSATTSPEKAIAQKAFLRLRPISRRGDLVAILDPFSG